MGIIICGLNGAGKSTLGKRLAKKLNFRFIDIENLYFPEVCDNYIYSCPRTHKEVEKQLFKELEMDKNFILASVHGNYGENIYPFFQCAILLEATKDVRLQRVKKRSFEKFGNRMLPGGDLYEQEQKFFHFVEYRDNISEKWVKSLKCPIIRIDATKSVEYNMDIVIKQIKTLLG